MDRSRPFIAVLAITLSIWIISCKSVDRKPLIDECEYVVREGPAYVCKLPNVITEDPVDFELRKNIATHTLKILNWKSNYALTLTKLQTVLKKIVFYGGDCMVKKNENSNIKAFDSRHHSCITPTEHSMLGVVTTVHVLTSKDRSLPAETMLTEEVDTFTTMNGVSTAEKTMLTEHVRVSTPKNGGSTSEKKTREKTSETTVRVTVDTWTMVSTTMEIKKTDDQAHLIKLILIPLACTGLALAMIIVCILCIRRRKRRRNNAETVTDLPMSLSMSSLPRLAGSEESIFEASVKTKQN